MNPGVEHRAGLHFSPLLLTTPLETSLPGWWVVPLGFQSRLQRNWDEIESAGCCVFLVDRVVADQDKLVYVKYVIKGKLLESKTLRQQAANNTKEQFANSPDLKLELLNAIMGALNAHTTMSTQALNSEIVQRGLKDILLNNAGLYETLRAKTAG